MSYCNWPVKSLNGLIRVNALKSQNVHMHFENNKGAQSRKVVKSRHFEIKNYSYISLPVLILIAMHSFEKIHNIRVE